MCRYLVPLVRSLYIKNFDQHNKLSLLLWILFGSWYRIVVIKRVFFMVFFNRYNFRVNIWIRQYCVYLRRSTRSWKTGFISWQLTGSLSLNIRLPKRSLSSIYPEYSTETRRWVIRCLRSKLSLVFIWNRNQTREHFMFSWNQRDHSFKNIYAIVYDRPEICLCSLVRTKPDFTLLSIICKPSRKAKAESYITCEG